jgi:hypothetical protein
MKKPELIQPKQFDAQEYWYPKAYSATIHTTANFFLNLEPRRIVNRYCHLHPRVDAAYLSSLLHYKARYLQWSGADLIHVTSVGGQQQMVVIEVNSCPSGQKSMPLREEYQEMGGYKNLIEDTFLPFIKGKPKSEGALGVIYDKNPMECKGYAAAIAELTGEEVWLAEYKYPDADSSVRHHEGWLQIRNENGDWKNLRAVFRYVTQKPWNRIPLQGKTLVFNPIVACLAGGRNKMIAAKAYNFFNAELETYGLRIQTPETFWNVSKEEIPLYVNRMGGQAVIKVPYSNAGQGVYTIVNKAELDYFMAQAFDYEQFIVQSLIGNYNWSSVTSRGKLYHVGTVPDSKGESYVCDLRMMVQTTESGFRPLCIYARRGEKPLMNHLPPDCDSWEILGTNLSVKLKDGWDSDTSRLLLMDRRDFNKIGIGLDNLIDGYVQTVLAVIAIDKMAANLMQGGERFNHELFDSLNPDKALMNEILQAQGRK